MIRTAMLSFWHVHARDYARQAIAHPDTEIVAAWDELHERGRTQAQDLSVRFYEHLDDALAQQDVDGVIVDAPTSMHRDVLVAAARAGKHIFTEKVLAATMADAEAIVQAVNTSGVVLTVSSPRLNDGYTTAILGVLQEGLLGTLTMARVRLSHNGAVSTPERPGGWLPPHFYNREQTGGGAMIDLGCHPMYLTRLFLDMPEGVTATFGSVTGKGVDDNSVVILDYTNGAFGIVEAGFVNRHSPFTIEIHGTEGSLLYGTPESMLLVRSPKMVQSREWTSQPVPPDAPSAFQQWVGHIQHGTRATENIQAALDLTRLMEAATRSAERGARVAL